jgi:hypothetical protein
MLLPFVAYHGQGFSVPSFSLRQGKLVELLLPAAWDPDDTGDPYKLVLLWDIGSLEPAVDRWGWGARSSRPTAC